MIAYVAIGSNIRPEENVPRAIGILRKEFDVRRVSPIYESPAWTRPAQPPFWNAVAQLHTTLEARALRAMLKEIEHKLDRVRTADKHAARTIDLDVIAAGRYTDPEITTRPFLAVPLFDVEPGYRLPSGRPLREIVQQMQRPRVKRVGAKTPPVSE